MEREGSYLVCRTCGLRIPYVTGRVIHNCDSSPEPGIREASVFFNPRGEALPCRVCGARVPVEDEAALPICAAPRARESGRYKPRTTGAGGGVQACELQCRSRFGPPELRDCRPCVAAGRTPLVWGCAVHGRCSLGSFGFRRVMSCLTCPDREMPESPQAERGTESVGRANGSS